MATAPAGAPAPIDFYFDFLSSYGYAASLRIEAIAGRHGREVRWHIMLLGVAVMKVMGLKPLLETPLKGDYVRRDFARYERRHGLELARTLSDPMMDPRPAARAFCWVKRHHAGREGAFAHAHPVAGRKLRSALKVNKTLRVLAAFQTVDDSLIQCGGNVAIAHQPHHANS